MKKFVFGCCLIVASLAAACGGSSIDAACNFEQQCAQKSGDSTFSVTECRVKAQEEMDKATNAGCASQADAVASCVASLTSCEADVNVECGAQIKALTKCLQ